jgi:hypothetical protein
MAEGGGKDRPWTMMKRNEAADKLQTEDSQLGVFSQPIFMVIQPLACFYVKALLEEKPTASTLGSLGSAMATPPNIAVTSGRSMPGLFQPHPELHVNSLQQPSPDSLLQIT